MNADLYLKRLQAELKGFSPEDQAQLLEEIAAHIEAGENDPGLGQDAAEHKLRLEKELGSPDDLGRRLRQVHRPGRWLDFLLVALPALLIFPFLPLFAQWITGQGAQNLEQTNSLMWISVRLSIILQTGLVLLARWKGSPGVFIHWLSAALLTITGLLLSEIRWAWLPVDTPIVTAIGLPEMVFWLAALVLLLVWLVRWVLAQRSEPLLVILAVIPFLFAAANYAAGLAVLNHQTGYPGVVQSLPVIGWYGLFQITRIIWPALFFLPDQRDLRWAGLMMIPVTYALYYVWPYLAFPWIATLYLLPALVVFGAWLWDARSRWMPATH